MINSNIGINDAKYNTNAPFTYNCNTEINGERISVDYFRSIIVYCIKDTAVPVRISRVVMSQVLERGCVVHLSDANGEEFGTFTVKLQEDAKQPWIGTFITSHDKLLSGHVVYSYKLAGILLDALSGISDHVLDLGNNSFVLLPQCHRVQLTGYLRSFDVNGHPTVADVYPFAGIGTSMGYMINNQSEPFWHQFSIGIMKYKEIPVHNKLCRLRCTIPVTINGEEVSVEDQILDPVWIGGEHMYLRHSATSNIRVTTLGEGIKIGGV